MLRNQRSNSPYCSVWAIAFTAILAALLPAHVFAKSFTFGGVVVKIHDGDTISVVRRGHAEKVRLAGIDCPELRQSFGSRAKNFTNRLASGQMVTVRVQGSDDYGRRIGVVILPDGRSLNRELVAAGLAWKAKESKNKELAKLEKEARRAKRGLWADADPTPPWEYRKAKSAKR
jgi:endonuclease YncB( thermonuclease family)